VKFHSACLCVVAWCLSRRICAASEVSVGVSASDGLSGRCAAL